MITEVVVKRFKLFEEEKFELDDVVLLVGPNNSGKTTLLQAIATWYLGLQRWQQERGEKPRAKKRTGVPITRKEFTVLPLREMNLLWTERQTGARGKDVAGIPALIEIVVKGKKGDEPWEWSMEFQYANPEMVYVRPLKAKAGAEPMSIPEGVKDLQIVHIPPFSGIVAEEPRHDVGYQNLLIGQGRPGETIRNLLEEISAKDEHWDELVQQMKELFAITLKSPVYAPGQPFIVCEYVKERGRPLDIANIGSGSLQVLMLLAFFYARPATILLLDEPDAHLHIILQNEVYDLLRKAAYRRDCQLIIATHSEVLLDSTDPSRVIAMLGAKVKRLIKPVDRDQLREALKRLRNVELMLGDEIKAVLYVEGESDERILREWAKILKHPAQKFLDHPFIHYLGGRSLKEAKDHFFALRAAFPGMRALCIIDGDNQEQPDQEMITGGLKVLRWRRYEIENYLLIPDAIKRFAGPLPLFESGIEEEFWKQIPKGTDLFGDHVSLVRIKASREFLVPLLESIGKPIPPRDLYLIAAKMKPEEIHPEVKEKLDTIAELLPS
jgi:energy-coupling factor transporter ATP-binding protein EcfA2